MKKNNMNNKYIYASVSYEDDISHRTYYYISDIEDLEEGQRVLVDRNGIEAIGIVEKIEVFKKDKVPFPIEKTKHIIEVVDDDFDLNKHSINEYEKEIESYKKLFLNAMFSRLSITRLMNFMFLKKEDKEEMNDTLYYMPRLNLFFYWNDKDRDFKIAETSKEILSYEVFVILERESIEIPRKIVEEIYTDDNYKEAVFFCREYNIPIHDDIDSLQFFDAKLEVYPYEKTKKKKKKFKEIDDVIEYLKNYKSAKYVNPEPNYYIDDNRIIHYMGWLEYDDEIFDLYNFLNKKGYINIQKAHIDYNKHGKEWENWYRWNINKLNYDELNYTVVRLYSRERICEGIIDDYAKTGKLLKIIKLIKKELKNK